ncbi:MAG TPA: TonB-dependent receptor [Bacteroidales bacterium]|nr:TonB-dependent receptor [Bacteroidales bacterium]
MKRSAILLIGLIALTLSVKAQINTDTIKLTPIEIRDSILKKIPYVLTNIQKDQIDGEAIRDVGDYLRSIPNVSGVRKGGVAVDPVVRGFKFSQLNVILDNGVKVENGCPNRMDPVSSHVEAEDIENIEVIKGPFMLKYGPALGGVINLVSEKPHPYEKFEIHAEALYGFETNWDGQKEHLLVYGGNKKIYFLLTGAIRDYGNYQSGNSDGHDTTFNASFRKYGYGAKLGYSPKKNHSILISYNEIHGRNVLYPALPMDEKSDDTRMIALDYNATDLSAVIKSLDLKIYYSDVDHLMDNSQRANWASKQMVSDVDALNIGGRAELGMQVKKHKIFLGLDYENIYKDGARTMTMLMMGTTTTKVTNLWKDARIQNIGLFAEYKTLLSSFEIDAALRLDYNHANSADTLKLIKSDIEYFNDVSTQFINFSISMGVTKEITDGLYVSLALGRGTRSPNMLERFIKLMPVGYDNFDYLGDPQLKPEKNNEVDLTFKYSNDKIGNFYLNGFYSYVQDYISGVMLPSSVVTPQTSGSLGVKQFVNMKSVGFTGAEFGYTSPEKYRLGGSMVAAYTYGYTPTVTKYIVTGSNVTGDTILKNDALSEIPPLETTVSIYYKFLKGKLVPKISARIVADQRHVSEAFYEPYTPGFALLNFSVKYNIIKYVSVSGGINNIFDRSYYEHLNRKIIGTSGKLYEPGRVFYITVNVKI